MSAYIFSRKSLLPPLPKTSEFKKIKRHTNMEQGTIHISQREQLRFSPLLYKCSTV